MLLFHKSKASLSPTVHFGIERVVVSTPFQFRQLDLALSYQQSYYFLLSTCVF